MTRSIVFPSPLDAARFLWGDPRQDPRTAPVADPLRAAMGAWQQQQHEPGGTDKLRRALMALAGFVREQYFELRKDSVVPPGVIRQLVALGLRADMEHPASRFWVVCAVDATDDTQIVATLRAALDKEYGTGFFADHVVSVTRIADSGVQR